MIDRHLLLPGNGVPRGVEAVQVAQQESQRVAHASIGVRHALQDLVRHAHLIGIVGCRDPQAHHVGAERARQLLRHQSVADGLGHLAALLVHRETVREHAAIGGAAMHGH